MQNLDLVIAYVDNAPKSAELYGKLLGLQPIDASPNWAMFKLQSGMLLGLWARHEVEPPVTGRGGAELCVAVENDETVATSLAEWKQLGLKIIQLPTAMDFGLTFTAEDTDGNRLRLYAPARRGA